MEANLRLDPIPDEMVESVNAFWRACIDGDPIMDARMIEGEQATIIRPVNGKETRVYCIHLDELRIAG
jgi:hypothetical protein